LAAAEKFYYRAVGDYLLCKGYFFFVATHRRKP
jgi:hypothetical protein